MRTEFKIGIFVIIFAVSYYRYKGSGPVMLIETKSGHVSGVSGVSRDGREYFKWLQIPYAQPPVGPLRFASPRPVKRWDGIRDGGSYGPACAQLEILTAAFTGEEDCLHLNIFRPKVEKGLLPVMVYIGGAFIAGYSRDFEPDYFMDEDVILITINYRVGMLGFLSTGDKVIRGNMGLKDQVLALTWIKENIQAFGGDPEKITIFGESAGGSSVHHLLLSEKTKGLFQRAISMSGVVNFWGLRPSQIVADRTKNFAKSLNCPVDNSQTMTDCLRKLSVTDLLHAFFEAVYDGNAFKPSGKGEVLNPIVELIEDEESFLTESPLKIAAEGRAHKIPWMTGYVVDDGLITSASFYREQGSLDMVENNFDEQMHKFFYLSVFPQNEADEFTKAFRKFYFSHIDSSKGVSENFDLLFKAYTDFFTDGVFSTSTQAALVQREFSPVYAYYYNRTGGPGFGHAMSDLGTNFRTKIEYALMLTRKFINQYIFGVPPRDLGTCHMDELLMLFPMFDLLRVGKNPDCPDYKFSKEMTKLWVDFAKDETTMKFRGVPFVATGKEGKLKVMVIDEHPAMTEEPEGKRQEFWRSINYLQRYGKAVQDYSKRK